jgi:hypothetical protein
VWELSPGEWYENVSAGQIAEVLLEQGWEGIDVRQVGLDTQGKAVKPLPVPPILHVEQLTEVKRGEPREVLFGAVLSRTSAGR